MRTGAVGLIHAVLARPWALCNDDRCALRRPQPVGSQRGSAHRGRAGRASARRASAALARGGGPGPVLDWITAALLVLGLIFVATGLLPHHEASATIRRILPLLLFLGSIVVLAELTADAGVFDVIAVRAAGLARGNY